MVFRLGFDFFLDFGIFPSDVFPDGLHPSVTYLAGSNERIPMQVFEFDGKLYGVWSYLRNKFHGGVPIFE